MPPQEGGKTRKGAEAKRVLELHDVPVMFSSSSYKIKTPVKRPFNKISYRKSMTDIEMWVLFRYKSNIYQSIIYRYSFLPYLLRNSQQRIHLYNSRCLIIFNLTNTQKIRGYLTGYCPRIPRFPPVVVISFLQGK